MYMVNLLALVDTCAELTVDTYSTEGIGSPCEGFEPGVRPAQRPYIVTQDVFRENTEANP